MSRPAPCTWPSACSSSGLVGERTCTLGSERARAAWACRFNGPGFRSTLGQAARARRSLALRLSLESSALGGRCAASTRDVCPAHCAPCMSAGTALTAARQPALRTAWPSLPRYVRAVVSQAGSCRQAATLALAAQARRRALGPACTKPGPSALGAYAISPRTAEVRARSNGPCCPAPLAAGGSEHHHFGGLRCPQQPRPGRGPGHGGR